MDYYECFLWIIYFYEYFNTYILDKLKRQALNVLIISNRYVWYYFKNTVFTSYSDNRDCFNLNFKMSERIQLGIESPYNFYERIPKLLNFQTAFIIHKDLVAKDVLYTYTQKLVSLRVLLRGLHKPLVFLMQI